MNNRTYGYARVSSREQNEDSQILRNGDTLVIKKLDRLSRNKNRPLAKIKKI